MNTLNSRIQFGNKYRRYLYNRMMPFVKSRRGTAYMMISLSLFTVSFFGFFAIKPTVGTIVELKRQIEDSQKVASVLQKKIDTLVEAQEEYQLVRDFVPVLDDALPDEPRLSQLLAKIDAVALENQATISGLSVAEIKYDAASTLAEQENAGQKIPSNIRLSLIIKGSYRQIAGFIDNIVNTRRIITLDSLEMIPLAAETNAPLELSLTIKGHYRQ